MADQTRTKTRIYELTETTTLTSDMNLAVDTQEGGTKRVQLSTLIDGDLNTAGKAADAKAVGDALDTKVDKVEGKGLSEANFTSEEKSKLSGIAAGATAVAIDSTLTQTGQAADAKKTGDEISDLKTDLSEIELGEIALESGTYTDADGTTKTVRNTRIRNKYKVSLREIESITMPEGYEVWYFVLNSSGTLIQAPSTWMSAIVVSELSNAADSVNFGIRKTSAPTSDISGEVTTVQSGIVINYKQYALSAELSDAQTKIRQTANFSKFSQLYGSMFSQGGLGNSTGNEYPEPNFVRTGFIPVFPGELLTVTNLTSVSYCYSIHQYNSSKTWVSALTIVDSSESKTFTIDTNAYFIRVVICRNGYGNLTPQDVDSANIRFKFDVQPGSSELSHKLANAQHVQHLYNVTPTPQLTLLHFSDLHKDINAMNRIITCANSLTYTIDDMICTGDMAANTAEQISSWWNPNVLTCIGNHDTASYSSGSGYNWTALSMADRDAYYIAPFESGWGIMHTSGKSYYYKDYTSQKIRLIVMDCMLYTDNGADATAQTEWLSELLASAITNNLHVLIAIHAPHGGATAENCSFSKYGQGTMPTDADCNTPQAVIDAVAAKITNGLKFIGYLVGHTHQDNMWDAEGDGKQMMYCITCANVFYSPQWANSDQHRGTTEDAYNLITIDTDHTLVKIIRGGGADIDDHMRARKAICFNYSTGEMVGEVL